MGDYIVISYRYRQGAAAIMSFPASDRTTNVQWLTMYGAGLRFGILHLWCFLVPNRMVTLDLANYIGKMSKSLEIV